MRGPLDGGTKSESPNNVRAGENEETIHSSSGGEDTPEREGSAELRVPQKDRMVNIETFRFEARHECGRRGPSGNVPSKRSFSCVRRLKERACRCSV